MRSFGLRGSCASVAAAMVFALGGCGGAVAPAGPTAGREPCANRNALRNVYFGDLHVHTAYSFDAYVFGVRVRPEQAYRFARGEPVELPPRDAQGRGTQRLRIDRPLDFAAVTDHSEFLGEVESCTAAGWLGFDSGSCAVFRSGGNAGQNLFGTILTQAEPRRLEEVCGAGGESCRRAAGEVWGRVVAAAEAAYDRTSACRFTAFVAYEYTGNPKVSTNHRNVIFRTATVPFPISYMEEPTALGLWRALRARCIDADPECDVLAIPHNPNQSNGNMFFPDYPGARTPEEQQEQARLRSALEPLVEIYQHKGDSECMNGLSGIATEPDELCEFEKLRRPPLQDCGDGTGRGGVSNAGCVSRLDYARGFLLAGLQEYERLGVNPYRLGFVAGTDTHNGTPGAAGEDRFVGHRGDVDDTPEKRLAAGGFRSGIAFSPGGLAAVWAEENSRESLFAALARRETYGTSGPRIVVRFFGGWDFSPSLCEDPDFVAAAYRAGVPMGGVLPPRPGGAAVPVFAVAAMRDPGTAERPGALLQRVQIVKGWRSGGQSHIRVFEVAGDPQNGASVDEETCERRGSGFASLCAVWADPEFDPGAPAFYYARVLENPSCRWVAYQCNALPPPARPAVCGDPAVPKTVQERAWTSPIWYDGTSGSGGVPPS